MENQEKNPPKKLLDRVRDRKGRSSKSNNRTIQHLLGYAEVSTTMIYTHVLKNGAGAVFGPMD